MIAITSRGVERIAHLDVFLGETVARYRDGLAPSPRAFAGWGLKPSTEKSRRLASKMGLPFLALEDGFLRSVDVGPDEPPLSMVVDDLGIYYDARQPSRLEVMVARSLSEEETNRALALRKAWCLAAVSKYNHGQPYRGELPKRYVLVIDQTFGDASIAYGLADANSFSRMLECALAENPDCQILLKVHPEVMQGRKQGHFNLSALKSNPRVLVLGVDAHPCNLLAQADSVYVVTSQMGFEGLLWGKRVRTFGMPFYAGWGLTEDELVAPARRQGVPLENLIHGALIDYPRYIDPETGAACGPERVIEWMGFQRQMRERYSEKMYAVGFSDWKKPIVRDFFQGRQILFVDRLQKVPKGFGVIAWGMKSLEPPVRWFEFGIQSAQPEQLDDRDVVRVEDGFLRSVGLGADLIRPLSWVTDTSGIYYDATRTSDLEKILQNGAFDPEILVRSAALRQRIVSSGLTKYNVGSHGWQRPSSARWVILVPGQVESDASIAYGAPAGICAVRRNMDLLRAVREANPEAYIVYKPHPDVLAGLRLKGVNEGLASQWCDEQVVDISMGEMLDEVDEVHVITSLAGFEALLRGKKVTCYGQPFYSSWGLTTDIAPVARRTRLLSLDELVAGVLILYPTYVSRITLRFTSPERALDELLLWREVGAQKLSVLRRLKRIVLGLFKQ